MNNAHTNFLKDVYFVNPDSHDDLIEIAYKYANSLDFTTLKSDVKNVCFTSQITDQLEFKIRMVAEAIAVWENDDDPEAYSAYTTTEKTDAENYGLIINTYYNNDGLQILEMAKVLDKICSELDVLLAIQTPVQLPFKAQAVA